MEIDRREFGRGLVATAFAGLSAHVSARSMPGAMRVAAGYGPLQTDPAGLIDLPRGFSYTVISAFGGTMADGFRVPDRFDGMGAFAAPGGRVVLVRNHELKVSNIADGPAPMGAAQPSPAFDRASSGAALPGGTTTLLWNPATGRMEEEWLSLVGTIRNCAGGTTPWGSWLSCEEDMTRAGNGVGADHGFVFEVPASHRGIMEPLPLKAMGRFNHEAAAVDPDTGIVYMTEDREDGLLYRFLPASKGELANGGRLQALVVDGVPDTRNWRQASLGLQNWKQTRWVDLDGVEAPDDDLRARGEAKGATLFARGEGLHVGTRRSRNELYFCCTSGGARKLGQVMRYRPSRFEGQLSERTEPGRLQIFVESTDPGLFNFGDNLTVAPNGHLIVCEDQYTDVVDNHLRGVTPDGRVYALARTPVQTEFAGACFAPDGQTFFVNLYSPGKTLSIRGPWSRGV